MPDLDIVSTSPIVTPQVPSKTFDLWRIFGLVANWPDPQGPMSLDVFWKSALREPGATFLTDGPTSETHRFPNIWEEAASDPEVADALYRLTKVLEKKAKAAKVIK